MPTAFGRAMISAFHGDPATVQMRKLGQNGAQYIDIQLNCHDYLVTRDDELQMLSNLGLRENAVVLDYGCGLGRHLGILRNVFPNVHLYGIDICHGMLEHCRDLLTNNSQFATNLLVLDRCEFDLIMLMGNGLGVFGGEVETRTAIRRLLHLLKPSGKLIIEFGNPFGTGFTCPNFTITYEEQQDGPFQWGHADKEWMSDTFSQEQCAITFSPSRAPGGFFSFATVTPHGSNYRQIL